MRAAEEAGPECGLLPLPPVSPHSGHVGRFLGRHRLLGESVMRLASGLGASADDDSGNAAGDPFHRAPRGVEGEGDQELRASAQRDREEEGKTECDDDSDDPDRVAQEVAPVARALDHPGDTLVLVSSSASTATRGLPRLSPSPAGVWQPAEADPVYARPRFGSFRSGRPVGNSSHRRDRELHASAQRDHEAAGRTERDHDADDPDRVAQEVAPVAARALERPGDTSASLLPTAQAPTAALPRLKSSPVVPWQPVPKAQPMHARPRSDAFRMGTATGNGSPGLNAPGFVDIDDLIDLPADPGLVTSGDLDDLIGLYIQCQEHPQQQPLPHLDRGMHRQSSAGHSVDNDDRFALHQGNSIGISKLVSFVRLDDEKSTQDIRVSRHRCRQKPLPPLANLRQQEMPSRELPHTSPSFINGT